MAYNLLGQPGPYGERNPDPNLTDEQATYLYEDKPGSGDNKGLDAKGKPVDAADVAEKLADVGVEDEAVTEEEVVETVQPPKTTGKDEIRNIQTFLKNAGFDPGPIDGLVGPLTRGAALNYVKSLSGQAQKDAYKYYSEKLGGIGELDIDTTPTEVVTTEEDGTVTLYDQKGKPVTGIDPKAVERMLESGLFFKTKEEADTKTIILYDKDGKEKSFPLDGPWKEYVDNGTLFIFPPGQEVDVEDTTKKPEGGKTAEEVAALLQGGAYTPADITSYEIDKLNQELGFAGTGMGSAIKRAWNRINEGLYTVEEANALSKQLGESFINILDADSSVATRLGGFVNFVATSLGVTGKAATVFYEELLGSGLNALYDIVEPDVGGAGDAFIDAALGTPGQNTFSDWWIDKYGTYRYDSFSNSIVDVSTGETVASIGNAKGDKETQKNNEETIPTVPGGAGGAGQVDEGPLYWGRYDSGSWATSTLPGKPDGFKWAWELEEFPDKNQEQYISDKSIEEVLTLVGEPEKIELSEQTVTLYKRGESPITVPYWQVGEYLSRGWSTSEPVEGGFIDVTSQVTGTDEVGPGQLVSDTLNEFNNVPQNSILIEAGGQLFLGYEVPGAYGQMYNGNPIFMLYEVLNNDVFEAGLLTQGATPQINVSLGSIEDLNQYGIIVGGTDELTDDVEHPFIRFTENFEAGKRVNPWLNDTEINPVTGVTYQQEAIEFLAEQALEQWTPEQTQVRYEGSDWYRKSTTAQKTWLTTLLTQPVQAQQDIRDKQIEVKAAMEANGIASPPDALVNWVAEKSITGMWTQVYTDQQIALLADPYKPGARDTGMVNFIEGVGVGTLDRLTVGEKTVRDLYRRYLGPSLGNASNAEIAEKAGLLRSDPDAEEQLKAYLEQQRLAMFGKYTNPTLTYNDIVQPYKNLVNQVWGQEVDETQDWFIKMVQDNDIEKAYKTLREKGIDQGVERVQNQALDDLQRSIGQGQIAPQLGANT